MRNVQGGMTPGEFCCDLVFMIQNFHGEWTSEAWELASYSLNLCFGEGGFFSGNVELTCSQRKNHRN